MSPRFVLRFRPAARARLNAHATIRPAVSWPHRLLGPRGAWQWAWQPAAARAAQLPAPRHPIRRRWRVWHRAISSAARSYRRRALPDNESAAARALHALFLRMGFDDPGREQIERIEIGLGRGDNDIGIRTQAIDDEAVALQTHSDLALGIGAVGDCVDRIQLQFGMTSRNFFDRIEHRIDRAIALRANGLGGAVDTDRQFCGGAGARFRIGLKIF